MLRPTSTRYVAAYDVVVRRNVGIWHPAGGIMGLDDDGLSAADTVAACRRLLEAEPYTRGHHRHHDFGTDPHGPARLAHTPPPAGRSREDGVNRWHLYHSCTGR
ncbi:hypothetical protein J5X84_38040 [Streptosporangiaceae bacterium NEAU-GS5]|nr:hypothetical protein [Streptosporangiaceae bacterium NEAU-GS5]